MTQLLSDKRFKNEQGGVLVLMIFIFALIMAFAALAIDSANLYRAQRELQNAADAGVLAGLSSMIREHWDPSDASENEFIKIRAREVARENALAAGITPKGDPVVKVTPMGDVTVDIDAGIPLMLAHVVPNYLFGAKQYTNSLDLGAAAAGERRDRNIALVLDFSNSMKCPAPTADNPSPTCNCVGANRPSEQPPEGQVDWCAQEAENQRTPQKHRQMINTVSQFLEQFDEARDLISVTLYNTVAELAVPTTKDHRGFDKDAIIQTLKGYTPGGATNLSDGLITAYVDMESARNDFNLVTDRDQTVYVVLSDGAPTAGRFLFAASAIKGGMQANTYMQPTGSGSKPLADAPGYYDYIHYTLHWPAVGDTPAYEGPSLFLKKNAAIPFGFTSAIPPEGFGLLPSCLTNNGISQPESDPTRFEAFFRYCLNNLGFVMPYAQGGTVYGANYECNNAASRWREQYANAAIQIARHIQAQGGLVYTIGYGIPESNTASPYQFDANNMSNPHLQKEVLLAALAGNYKYITEHNHPSFGYENHTPLDAEFVGQANFYNFNPIAQSGDNTTLSGIFQAIAADIKLKARLSR